MKKILAKIQNTRWKMTEIYGTRQGQYEISDPPEAFLINEPSDRARKAGLSARFSLCERISS